MVRRSKLPICGNGIVENGEDCDSGFNKSSILVEACCNPRTCRFYTGAECLSGACCQGCKLLPSGHICRASQNVCDVPEFCDGVSAQCPEDNTIMDGSSCHDNNGICFRGMCVGAQQQCIDIWGPGAKVAHDSCYSTFNPSGSMTGHCGYDSRLHKYIPCFDKDVKCGLLHCEGGMPYPRVSSSNFMIFNVNTRDGSFECKTISSPLNSILVSDGNICEESSFCQNNVCIQQKTKSTCNAQKTCSGNGICTSMDTCFCNPSWKGQDCSIYDFKQDMHLLNRSLSYQADTISPTAFFGITTITFLLFLLCIIISCIYRNKTPRHRRKSHELTVINQPKLQHPHVTFNPTNNEFERTKLITQYDSNNHNIVSTPLSIHRTPLKRSPLMTSNRSITSICTGHSYLPTDTPHSVRYINRKTSTNDIFSDSETPRTRVRRQARHIGSPYLQRNSNRHHHHQYNHNQQTYATLTLKRHHDINIPLDSPSILYDGIDKLSKNENLRDIIQVLDTFAQEKFGSTNINKITYEKDSTMPSSPTETNASITLDSGYQSTKQLMSTDEYATVVKIKQTNEASPERQRTYSSADNKQTFCT